MDADPLNLIGTFRRFKVFFGAATGFSFAGEHELSVTGGPRWGRGPYTWVQIWYEMK